MARYSKIEFEFINSFWKEKFPNAKDIPFGKKVGMLKDATNNIKFSLNELSYLLENVLTYKISDSEKIRCLKGLKNSFLLYRDNVIAKTRIKNIDLKILELKKRITVKSEVPKSNENKKIFNNIMTRIESGHFNTTHAVKETSKALGISERKCWNVLKTYYDEK
jgi:hypothetical protein